MAQQRDRDRFYKRSVGVLVIFSVLAVLVMLRLYQQTAGPFRDTLRLSATLPRADGVTAAQEAESWPVLTLDEAIRRIEDFIAARTGWNRVV